MNDQTGREMWAVGVGDSRCQSRRVGNDRWTDVSAKKLAESDHGLRYLGDRLKNCHDDSCRRAAARTYPDFN